MTDWSSLGHAYGVATDIPDLLARLSADPEDEVWEELWSCLCHQDTVYSASFAALPFLLKTASKWPPDQCVGILALAGAILASNGVVGVREEFVKGLEPTISGFQKLAGDCLKRPDLPRTDFIHLLQSARAFEGDRFWGSHLDNLVDGAFPGGCRACGEEFEIVVGENGVFSAADEWVNRPDIRTVPLEPAEGALPMDGDWMRQRAINAGRHEIALWIAYLFGFGNCPHCGSRFDVSDAIRFGYQDT